MGNSRLKMIVDRQTPLVELKWWSRDYGDAAERRFAYAKATEDRHDRGDQATGGGEEGRRGKEEGRGACPRRVSAEAKAGSVVQIATLPADRQEPARKDWAKVLRSFKCREPWL